MTEIWSGRSLNSLLRHLIAQQGQNVKGPNVPLNEDTLKYLNLTAGDTRGNVDFSRTTAFCNGRNPCKARPSRRSREELSRQFKLAVQTIR